MGSRGPQEPLPTLRQSASDEDRGFRTRQAGGRDLDMCKSRVQARCLNDLDLVLIAETTTGRPVDRFLATYERVRPI